MDPDPLVITTTPPDSFTSTPLTPPSQENGPRTSVSQILDEVRKLQRGRSLLDPWHRFHLTPDEYADLLVEVTKEPDCVQGYWEDKLKCDYFPSISTFLIRVPNGTHTRFITWIAQEITSQLQTLLSADSLTSDFARRIYNEGSTSLYFPDEYGRHDPDSSFGHGKAQFPGVIFEVSCGRKRRDLKRLAEDYMLGSDGSIRVVVGLDIEYQGKGKSKETWGKAATISVWRPTIIQQDGIEELSVHREVVDMEFRDKDSIANSSPTAGISLCLNDFTVPALPPSPVSKPIFISATTLAELLVEAEEMALMVEENRGVRNILGKGVKKISMYNRRAEELEEERAEKRVEKADES